MIFSIGQVELEKNVPFRYESLRRQDLLLHLNMGSLPLPKINKYY